MRRHVPLVLALLALAACAEDRLTAPSRAIHGAVVAGEPGFRFLPPTVPRRSLPTGSFDATRRPIVRVVCTGATGPSCPVVASFGGDAVRLEAASENYNVLWQAPGDLVPGADGYRLEVLDGAHVVGAGDLWVLDERPDRKDVPAEYVAVTRGSPLLVKFRIETQLLAGEPTAPAAAVIPDEPLVQRAEDYTTDNPALPGVVVSYNTVTLMLAPVATVADANRLLAAIDATIVGGIPGAGEAPGIMFVRVPTRSHAELDAVLAALRADPLVRVATPDIGLGVATTSVDGPSVYGNWTWQVAPAGPNWHLEASRVPQLWNFNNALAKTARRTITGVIDNGFGDHDDLTIAFDLSTVPARRHGTHIAGIIAAHANTAARAVGVEGVTPFADLAVTTGTATEPVVLSDGTAVSHFTSNLLTTLNALVRAHPGVRVVNVSQGYNWSSADPPIDPATNETVRGIVDQEGALIEGLLQGLVSAGFALPVIVSAAGNDNGGAARYASPLNSAALGRGVAPIIVVEALTQSGSGVARTALSNVGGHLSAPGAGIVSLDSTTNGYVALDGTSMAAAVVSGVASYLYTLAPDVPRPTMTTNAMRETLVSTAAPGGGAAPRVDAFAAALAVGGAAALRMLADVDDGTLHGNQRTAFGQDYETDDATDPAKARDDRVTMRDFRRWRDWLLQAEQATGLAHDGSSINLKKDLNGDGEVQSAALENVYPRGDYNGDGIISRTAVAPVRTPLGVQMLSDLAVMQLSYDDPIYEADRLPGLIASADLEIDNAACFEIPGAVTGRSNIRVDGSLQFLEGRDHVPSGTRRIYTAPVNAAGYIARTLVRDASGRVIASNEGEFGFRLGSQARWFPACYMLRVETSFPATLVRGEPTPIVITATLHDPSQGVTVPAPNTVVALGWNAGSVQQAQGVTNAAGTYTTFVTAPAAGSGTLTVTMLLSKWGQEVTRQASATYGP